ncbi:Alpha/Beta hydrolase protein [Zopfochytrium polystomum]|nr:Alpha/Beta hydrolase protein [Zopfochytrium polystomum]
MELSVSSLAIKCTLAAVQIGAIATMAATQLLPRDLQIRLMGTRRPMVWSRTVSRSAAVLLLNEAGVVIARFLTGSDKDGKVVTVLTNVCRLACILSWLRSLRNSWGRAERAVKAFLREVNRGSGDHEILLSFLLETVIPEGTPSNVDVLRNITYATSEELKEAGGERVKHLLQLDVIRRKKGFADRPILVHIHGGAWHGGDKSGKIPAYFTVASNHNWIVVNINYRLVPAVTLFEILCDCKRAIRWVRQNQSVHGGDAGFVAVSGGSAGGHIAALVALTQNDPAFQRGWENVDTSVQACVPIYAALEPLGPLSLHPLSGMHAYVRRVVVKLSDEDSLRLTGRPVEEWADPVAALRAVPAEKRSRLPPFFVVHGSADTLVIVEHSRRFFEELRGGSGAVVAGYLEMSGMHHTFDWYRNPAVFYLSWAMGTVLDALQEKWQGERGGL